MSFQNFTVSFAVDQSPDEVFAAVNDVSSWWGGDIEGNTDSVGDVWTYRYEDIHSSTQRITELLPGKRVAWHVEDAYVGFADDTTEWTGSDIIFDITETDGTTEVRFSHVGLTPEFECFEKCSSAWTYYIKGQLKDLIAQPTVALATDPA